MMTSQDVKSLTQSWETNARWHGVKRPYTAEDVVRLRGSVPIEYTLARRGAERLWKLLHEAGSRERRIRRLSGNCSMKSLMYLR